MATPEAHLSGNDADMATYFEESRQRALALGNRGPLTRSKDGGISEHILESYWKTGFYIFEGLLAEAEIADLQSEFAELQSRVPTHSTSDVDAQGNPAIGLNIDRAF